MIPALYGSNTVSARPLAGGDAGVAETVREMYRLVDAGVKDPVVNRYAIEIIRACPQYNPVAETRCIFEHVLENFRYVQHPVGPHGEKQRLMPVREILTLQAGDCPIFSELLATLLSSVGYETRFVTVASDGADPAQFNHIYVEAFVLGQWVAFDAARPDAEFARAPERYFRKKIWFPEGGGSDEGESMGCLCEGGYSRLNGYARTLGDATTNPEAQDITAITTGIADIELGSSPNASVYANLTPNVQGGGLPLLPSGTLPYGVPQTGLTISPTTLLLIAALGAVLLLGRQSSR